LFAVTAKNHESFFATIGLDGALSGEEAVALFAFIVRVYVTARVKPVKVIGDVDPLDWILPGLAVTV
jgi:hypothetical protein